MQIGHQIAELDHRQGLVEQHFPLSRLDAGEGYPGVVLVDVLVLVLLADQPRLAGAAKKLTGSQIS